MSLLRALALLITTCLAFAFDAQRAFDLANELGSDKFEGRRSGHPGGRRAEEFIADYCKQVGLSPAGKDGYYQEVPMLVTEEVSSSFAIIGSQLGKLSCVQGLDYTLATHSGSGMLTEGVVFVGHGIVNPEKHRDDYGALDVRGKLVVIIRGTPESPFDFGDEYSRSYTLRIAKERGAAAVLWYADPFPVNGAAIKEQDYDPDLPLVYVGDRILHVLLEGTGYSLDTYKSALKKAPLPLASRLQVTLSVKTKKSGAKSARNVLGIHYGSDPVLRNELIVVGAHLDHCGKNADGVIYNGAGDNASGSALIAELARSLVNGPPLKRSVLFIWFTGEEDGLLGSKYFAERPTLPFGNIVAMFNYDMVGQGDGGATMVGLELLGDVGRTYADSLRKTDKPPKIRASSGNGSSDYAPFLENGVPAVAFWASGEHPFYHSYNDDGRWLNVNSFATVGAQSEALLNYVGNRSETLASRSDTAEVLARHATTIDVDGFFLDQTGTTKRSPIVQLAWLSHDTRTPLKELVDGCAQLHAFCKTHDIVSSGLKDAVSARRSLKPGVALAITEMGLLSRTIPEVIALTKLGLSVVHLTPGADAAKRKLSDEAFDVLKNAGVYALVPLDYNTAPRVQRWGSQAIVTASLAQLAESPAEIRDPLLNSDALLLLDVTDEPTPVQLAAFEPARQRYVHLNFGESFDDLRESDLKNTVTFLLREGLTQDDILLLLDKNLRRFLKL